MQTAFAKLLGRLVLGELEIYTYCSFSSIGIGRFKPEKGAHPTIGAVGALESVHEERIEFVCARSLVKNAIAAIKSVHPYEEVALDIHPLEEL